MGARSEASNLFRRFSGTWALTVAVGIERASTGIFKESKDPVTVLEEKAIHSGSDLQSGHSPYWVLSIEILSLSGRILRVATEAKRL